jgi:hypothetical protein
MSKVTLERALVASRDANRKEINHNETMNIG